MFLVDLQISDQRVLALAELRMPAVVIGTPLGAGSLTAIWEDDADRHRLHGRVPGRNRAPADRAGHRYP